MAEASNDLALYRAAGESVLRGDLPYRDFFIEYPPGSLPFFVPPALFGESPGAHAALFAAEMALLLAASLVFVALAARRLRGGRAWPVPALAFAAGAALLYPVAVTRYDPVVTLSLAAAVFLAAGGRQALSYAVLGIGAAAKLVPALAVPALAMAGRGAPGALARGLAVFSGVLALFFVPAYLLGGGGFLESFAYHADRGLQLESVGASVLMALGLAREVVFEYGAFEVRGPGAGLLSSLSLPVTGVLLLATALAAWRERRAGRLGAGAFPRYAAALILAFMLGSKVLSPQYLLWLLPLVPLAAGGLRGAAASGILLAACWTTTRVYPYNYDALVNLEPGAANLLLVRNLFLVLLWLLVLLLPAERPAGAARKEPA